MSDETSFIKGRYDGTCSAVILATDADAVILIVLNGTNGSGFSVSCRQDLALTMREEIPRLLHKVADKLEATRQE